MASGIVDTVLTRVEDDLIRDMVFRAYTTLVSDYATTIGLMITLVIVSIGYQLLCGSRQFTVGDGVRKLVVALIAWGLLTNWHLFALLFYDTFTKGPNELAAALTHALTGKRVDSYAGLMDLYDDAEAVTMHLFSMVGLTEGWGYILPAVLYFLMALIAIGLAVAYILVAKLVLAVVLIIAPIPIALIMFERTRGIFASWLRALIGLSLLPVMIVAGLIFMLSIVGNDVHEAAVGARELDMGVLYGNMLVMGVSAFVFLRIMDIAQSIGAGINVGGAHVNDLVRRATKMGVSTLSKLK